MALQALAQHAVCRRCCVGPVHDDYVESRQLFLMEAEGLSNHSFDAVSAACLFTVLFRNGHTEAGYVVCFSAAAQDNKQVITTPYRFFEHAAESRSIKQPV